MMRGSGFVWSALTLLVWTAGSPVAGVGQANEHENLQALPEDISRDDLVDTMLGFLTALGLPRRAGEGCLHCHEGSQDVPRSEWDYASDANPTKHTARRMIMMVKAINTEHLGSLESRNAPDLEVGCATCHRGRVDPRPLPAVLAAAEEIGGLDSLVATYQTLFDRYYGGDAYDFRVRVLAGLASQRAEQGEYAEALRLAEANEQAHPTNAQARRVTLALRVQRDLDERGAEAAVSTFEALRASEPDSVLTYSVLDGIGWRTFRQDREAEALVLFRANREAFPELYFTFESLVEARFGAGEISRDEIIAEYVAWLDEHPGHRMAQDQLTNLRRRDR